MIIKRKSGSKGNPAPPHCFYPNRASMRGKMTQTHDGKAVLVFCSITVIIILYSIFSVINNNTKANENINEQIDIIKKRVFKVFKR